jgi:hypothetical protein
VSISSFWYCLRTAVPCLVVFLAVHPSTYRRAGLRRGTATSKFHEIRDNLRGIMLDLGLPVSGGASQQRLC